jgi:branched-chain amino acid transport system substrate-binding protein
MTVKKLFPIAIVLIGITACGTGFFPTTAAAAPVKTLQIGLLLQLSDWYSVIDSNELGDCQIVAQMINDKGGVTVKGEKYKVELLVEDGKSSLDGNIAAANRLVLNSKVKFVVGPSAFFSAASSPVFEDAKVIHVSGFSSMQPGEMDATTPYGFLGHNSPLAMQSTMLKALRKEYPNAKNLVYATMEDGSLKYWMPKLKKMIPDMGLNLLVDPIEYPQDMQDFSPIAAKMNAITKADVYSFVMQTPPQSAAIIKGVRTLGNQKPFVFYSMAKDILAMGGTLAGNDVVCDADFIPNRPGNPALMDELFNRGKPGRRFFGMTPNALWILAQVIQAANSLDPDAVKAKWESMKTVSTLFGTGVMCGDKTFGIKGHAVVHPDQATKIVNGVITDIGWFTPEPTP